MKPAHRRELAHHMVDAYRCSKRRAVRLIGISRSYFYYQPTPRDDRAERARIREIAGGQGSVRHVAHTHADAS